MSEYVTKVRTESGDKQIDYLALANLPKSDTTLTQSGKFADSKATGDKIKNHEQKTQEKIQEINTNIQEINTNIQNIESNLNSHALKVASDAEDGHMTSEDKIKLSGIENNANNYSLPTASNSTLGGVRTTSDITSIDGLTACPIIDGVPYCKNIDTSVTTNELNMLSGLSSVSEKPKMNIVTLSVNGWEEDRQTVNAEYVTINNLVFVSPEPSDDNYAAYMDSGVRCVMQSNGALVFSREYESKVDILVNVIVFV